MELDYALRNRRSVRQFNNEPVPDKLIRRVIEAGTLAPSASNKQHWRFIVVNNKRIINDLYEKAGAQPVVKNAPAVIAVVCSRYESQENNANIQSVSAAVQNMLLKAFELGLGTCWVCGFGDYDKAVRLLKIPDDYILTCIVLIGKPQLKLKLPQPPKKELSGLISYNEFKFESANFAIPVKTSCWNLKQLIDYLKFSSSAKGFGKDYEIYSKEELNLIKKLLENELQNRKKLKILNFLGYDGTIFKQIYPVIQKHEVYDCELDKVLENFVRYKVPDAGYIIADESLQLNKKFDLILFPYTLEKYPLLEKLPKFIKHHLSENGKAVMLIKNKNSFYGLMYFFLTKIFGIKTCEQFFYSGPFEPVSKSKVIKLLVNNGFKVSSKNLFLLPPEIRTYSALAKAYITRHSKKSKMSFLIRPALSVLSIAVSVINSIRLPLPSSTVAIFAEI